MTRTSNILIDNRYELRIEKNKDGKYSLLALDKSLNLEIIIPITADELIEIRSMLNLFA